MGGHDGRMAEMQCTCSCEDVHEDDCACMCAECAEDTSTLAATTPVGRAAALAAMSPEEQAAAASAHLKRLNYLDILLDNTAGYCTKIENELRSVQSGWGANQTNSLIIGAEMCQRQIQEGKPELLRSHRSATVLQRIFGELPRDVVMRIL